MKRPFMTAVAIDSHFLISFILLARSIKPEVIKIKNFFFRVIEQSSGHVQVTKIGV